MSQVALRSWSVGGCWPSLPRHGNAQSARREHSIASGRLPRLDCLAIAPDPVLPSLDETLSMHFAKRLQTFLLNRESCSGRAQAKTGLFVIL